MAILEEGKVTCGLGYGETVVTGFVVLDEEVKINGEHYITQVHVLSHGPIEAFTSITVNGQLLFKNGIGNFQSGVIGKDDLSEVFKEHVQVELWNGEVQGKRSLMAEAVSNGKWLPTSTLKGKSAIILKCRIIEDSSTIEDNSIEVKAKIKGRRVVDIRTDSVNEVYDYNNGIVPGTNPALVLVEFLTNPVYGPGNRIEDLDLYSFAEAANYCDANRITFNGSVSLNDDWKKIIPEMLNSFAAKTTRINGIITCIINKPGPVKSHFDLDQIINKYKVEYQYSKHQFNQLEATWNPGTFESASETLLYPPTRNDPQILKDKRVNKTDLSLPYTNKKETVDYLASVFLKEHKLQTRLSFEVCEQGFEVKTGDIISVTLEYPQWTKKLFRVDETSSDYFGKNPLTVKIEAIEYNDEIYTGTWSGVANKGTTDSTVPPAVNLRFSFVDSKFGLTGLLEWDQSVNVYESLVMYKLTAEPETAFRLYAKTNTNSCVFKLENAYYDFYVVNRSLRNVSSAISYLRGVDCFDETILPKATNLVANTDSADFTFTWDTMLNVDVPNTKDTTKTKVKDVLLGYEVNVTANNKLVATQLVQTNSFTYTYAENVANGVSRAIQVEVVLVAKQGARSPSANVNAVNPQQQVLSGIDVRGGSNILQVNFDTPKELDYRGVEVHISTTPGFTPSLSTLFADLTNTNSLSKPMPTADIYYVRVGGYDCFGHDNIIFSPEYQANVLDVIDILENIGADLGKDLLEALTHKASNTDLESVATTANAHAISEANKALTAAKMDTASTKATLEQAILDSVVDLGPITGRVNSIETTSVNADKALSSRIDVVVAKTNTNAASVTSLANTVTSNNNAIASRVNGVDAKVLAVDNKTATNTAKITSVETALATKDQAMATRVNALAASTTTGINEINSRAANWDFTRDRLNWNAGVVVRDSEVGYALELSNDAWPTNNFLIPVDTKRVYRLSAKIKQHTIVGSINSYLGVRTFDANGVELSGGAGTYRYCGKQGGTTPSVWTEFSGIITGEGSDSHNQFRAGTCFVMLMCIGNYSGGTGKARFADFKFEDVTDELKTDARLTEITNLVTSKDSATASRITTMETSLKADSTNKANAAEARAKQDTLTKYNASIKLSNDLNSARASEISAISTKAGVNSASITQTNNLVSTLTGKQNATWALRVDVNGHASGFGLSNDGAASVFAINADAFFVANGASKTPVFGISGGQTVIKNALIKDLSASNIGAYAIQASHLSANAIQATHANFNGANITNASIGFAKIADDIRSNNFALNSTGWQLTKAGALNATGINVQGYIFGSHIKGGLVEGAVVFGNEGYIQATSSDTGSGVRYGCYPRLRYDVTVDSALNSWSPYVEVPMCSHDYSGDGTRVISNITVANNFYRSRTAYPEVFGKIDIDCSRVVNLDIASAGITFNIHMDVSSMSKAGARTLIAQHLLCNQALTKQPAGTTQTYPLLSGWGGNITITWGDVSENVGNGNTEIRRKITSCVVTIISMPTSIVYAGNKRALQFRCHSGASNNYTSSSVQPSTMTLTVKGQ
jgi:hypothetical protein